MKLKMLLKVSFTRGNYEKAIRGEDDQHHSLKEKGLRLHSTDSL